MLFRTLFLCLIPFVLHARPGYYEPWGKDADLRTALNEQEPPPTPTHSLLVRSAEKVIRFHQNILSPVDGPRSHFQPSSSQYMLLAMHKHGFIRGFFLGCDRLMRENSADWVYRKVDADGKVMKVNPVP